MFLRVLELIFSTISLPPPLTTLNKMSMGLGLNFNQKKSENVGHMCCYRLSFYTQFMCIAWIRSGKLLPTDLGSFENYFDLKSLSLFKLSILLLSLATSLCRLFIESIKFLIVICRFSSVSDNLLISESDILNPKYC